MDCAMSTIKYIIFVFNFLFTLLGLIIMVLGIVALVKTDDYQQAIHGENFFVINYIVIGVGVAVFIIAFLGCCGAINESDCKLITYAILLMVILVFQIILGSIAFVYKSDVKDVLSKGFDKLFKEYDTDQNSRTAVNTMQKELKCCGINSSAYWAYRFPPSCCKKDVRTTERGSCPGGTWDVGCLEEMTSIFEKSLLICGIVLFSIGAIEIVLIIAAFCLANAIRDDYDDD